MSIVVPPFAVYHVDAHAGILAPVAPVPAFTCHNTSVKRNAGINPALAEFKVTLPPSQIVKSGPALIDGAAGFATTVTVDIALHAPSLPVTW
jgi:hypothetical protein